MRKIILFASFVLIVHIQLFAQTYQPKHAGKWNEISNYIKANWSKQRAVSKDLPFAYITVWPGLPFMFYWDSYFINEGLLMSKLDSFARNNTANLLYAVDKFGFIGNAVVTDWGMNRSQPPYLSTMVRTIYEQAKVKDAHFLRKAYKTLLKEYLFWTDTSKNAIENHSTGVAGLQRFFHHATDEELVILYGELADRFGFSRAVSDSEKIKIATPFAVEAASGMDFTTRFEHRSPDFISVELNSLLYLYEINFLWMEKILKMPVSKNWLQLAEQRKLLINQYCWDEARGLYLDYDFVQKRRSKVAAVTAYQPMWAGIASSNQAKRLVQNLPMLETEWGIATVEKTGEIKNYQWGETSVWAPMQLMVVKGLAKYGYTSASKRIAAKYLDLVANNYLNPNPASYTEKGAVVNRKKATIYEKYKADGTINDDEYKASEMFGWTAGSFLWLHAYYSKSRK
ncbi:MAG: trehalase [Sphingobacteriia bacterium]|nr:MAG: trehalase [Sphingobacteriia bacterium]